MCLRNIVVYLLMHSNWISNTYSTNLAGGTSEEIKIGLIRNITTGLRCMFKTDDMVDHY